MSYIILSPAHSTTLIEWVCSRAGQSARVPLPCRYVSLLTETNEAVARFFSSEHADKVRWTWSSTTPEKTPGTHTCKDRDSSRLNSQRISVLHSLIIDQHRSAGSKCSTTAFEVCDLCLSECWLKKKMFAIVKRNRIKVLNVSQQLCTCSTNSTLLVCLHISCYI